jgi:epoxyqueuosine reductase
MGETVVQELHAYAKQEDIIMGVASAEVLNEKAPEGFRPKDIMPDAKSVICFAKQLPLSAFTAPEVLSNMLYGRAAYIYYLIMDQVANKASIMMEKAGWKALPIPSYSPLRFYEGEPRGMISLKHAAQEAGLGKLGRNTLLVHPSFGNIMRLGAMMTDMEWPEYTASSVFEVCPENCRACEKACPINAISNGKVDKTACLGRCIKHIMLPPAFMLPLMKRLVAASPMMTRFMELFSLNFFETYGIGCTACLTACIHFPGNGKRKANQGQEVKKTGKR